MTIYLNNRLDKLSDYEMDCPVCGCEETHLEKVTPYKEKDGQLCVRLCFYCEFGCEWVIDFEQHEGKTYPYIKIVKKEGKLI